MPNQELSTPPSTPSLTPQWIYFAAPLFTTGEIDFNQRLVTGLREQGYKIYLPQEACAGIKEPSELYATCIRGLEGAGMVLIILDGTDADSGSCFEMGYAFAKGLPIVGLRTDFRGSGEHMGLNLMLTHSCNYLVLTQMPPLRPIEPGAAVTFLEVGADPLPSLLHIFTKLPAAQLAR